MQQFLEGRSALVTGAGAGIGRAAALRMARGGAHVIATDLARDAAELVAAEIRDQGGRAEGCALDIRDAGAIDAAVDAAVTAHGGLDVLVNNAATPGFGALADTDDDTWHACLAGTLHGVFYGLRAGLRVMRARGHGAIVNVSSGAGLGGEVGMGAYAAAKAAVINLTQTAAVENAAAGVRVNAVVPGPIDTAGLRGWLDTLPSREVFIRQIPQRRLGRPEEIANAIAFLASDEASYVNGVALAVDGAISARTSAPRSEYRHIEE
jgi:meso-butanediol dehydrogenase/(S,S)-butanediol dehydrogenase/diacetyl reductase